VLRDIRQGTGVAARWLASRLRSHERARRHRARLLRLAAPERVPSVLTGAPPLLTLRALSE
jgi:hypothetical protein